jgi:hypothetical protein
MVPEPSADGGALAANPVYLKLFTELGVGSLVVGAGLLALSPLLRRLITDESPTKPAAAPLPVAAAEPG